MMITYLIAILINFNNMLKEAFKLGFNKLIFS